MAGLVTSEGYLQVVLWCYPPDASALSARPAVRCTRTRDYSQSPLAGPASVLLAGVLSDKLFGSRRNPICVVCLMGSGVLLFFFDKFPHTPVMLGGCLFLLGLLLFPPDSLVSGTAAVDFGTRRGAATAAGLINGCGSIGAIVGGTIPGIFHDRWGWNGVFVCLSATLIVSGLLLFPQWNALPKTNSKTEPRKDDSKPDPDLKPAI